MKKVLLAVLASVLCVGFAPSVAMAAQCNISNTGPDSHNECTNEKNNECDVTNNNDVNVGNENNQGSSSGDADNGSNTGSGSANSGDTGNNNDSNVDVDIDNGSCTPAESVTPPTGGGQGGGTPATNPAVESASTELPDTGSSMVIVGAATAFVLGTASALATKKLLSDEN